MDVAKNMYISFVYPGVLFLLIVLVILWALAFLTPRRLGRWRFWASLTLRSLLFLLLIGSLAGTQLVRSVEQLTTVFLIDSSDSVGPETRVLAEQWVQDALKTMSDSDRAAIVVFGENALVERAPSAEKSFNRLLSVPVASRTNLGDALTLGLALFPSDTQKRMVLLSDGGENAGDVRLALELAATRGVPIEVVSLAQSAANDLVQLSELRAPSTVRKGQTVVVQAVVEAAAPGPATLRIRAAGEIVNERQVQLKQGRQTFDVEIKPMSDGFVRYEAEIVAPNDSRKQNNQAAVLVDVQGEPRVLVVEGTPGDGQNLADALKAASMNPTVVAPQSMPDTLADLGGYNAVVLVNVHAGALPARAMQTLPAYVRELGRGLVMVGGDRTFGVGGYAKTPIEAALPVDMEVRDKQRRPDVAIVFVIDKSGSMAACHCDGSSMTTQQLSGGVAKVDIAKDAVLQASAVLQPSDQIGVVAFDSAPHWAVQTQKLPALDQIQEAIGPIAPDGQTNVRGGLLAAKAALEKTDAKVKHVILVTDGWSTSGDNVDIAQELRDEGITLSTVAAGAGSAPYLERLAEIGAGRYYAVRNMEDVPRIFVEETIKAVGSFIVERPFVPTLVGDSPILAGLTGGGWPTLYGYDGTQIKDTAREILRSPDGDPILAQWQYGLGRSVAWTSDAKGKWGIDLVRWDQFGRFAAQLVGWTIPAEDPGLLTAEAHVEGTDAVIVAELQDASEQPRTDANVTATVVMADGTTQQIPLKQVAPGQYQASVSSLAVGSYLVRVGAAHAAEQLAATTVGLVVPYSPEYRLRSENPALLEQIAHATGGRMSPTPLDVFRHDLRAVQHAQEIGLPLLLLALLLLPLDIAVRRLSLQRRDLREVRAAIARRPRPARASPLPVLGDLQRAKARAHTRHSRQPVADTSTSPPAGVSQRVDTMVESSGPDAQDAPGLEEPQPSGGISAEERMARLRAAKARAARRR